MIRLTIPVLLCLLAGSFLSCSDKGKDGKQIDTPTSGYIKIAVDESLRPLIEAEIDVFESIYAQADIEPVYMSEENAIQALLQDSVRLAIVTRKLVENEKQRILVENITPRELDIATGAAALIVNKANADTLLRMSQLKEIVTGSITDWKQINPKSPSLPLVVVFDKPASGMARFLMDSVAQVKTLPSNFFAVNTNEEVINYVTKTPNAIGIIGVEWISDHDDSTANRFLSTVKVMGLARDEKHFKPFQAYIATHDYPLTRKTTVISREARAGLGNGFIAFLMSEKGQRIVLKAGLVPATMPIRLVEFKRQPVQYK